MFFTAVSVAGLVAASSVLAQSDSVPSSLTDSVSRDLSSTSSTETSSSTDVSSDDSSSNMESDTTTTTKSAAGPSMHGNAAFGFAAIAIVAAVSYF
ncbi:hypothetical protein FB645_000393 [Coemansia sp. IMI 203386]|nr:hypothetical protein FB645_000393 [Coemansia sp. IMI 203386]